MYKRTAIGVLTGFWVGLLCLTNIGTVINKPSLEQGTYSSLRLDTVEDFIGSISYLTNIQNCCYLIKDMNWDLDLDLEGSLYANSNRTVQVVTNSQKGIESCVFTNVSNGNREQIEYLMKDVQGFRLKEINNGFVIERV